MPKIRPRLQPIHPGEVLFLDFMKPLGISINALSRELRVPPNRIHSIIHGTRSITADTALRLAKYFGTDPQTWMSLQSEYDLRLARRTTAKGTLSTIRRHNSI